MAAGRAQNRCWRRLKDLNLALSHREQALFGPRAPQGPKHYAGNLYVRTFAEVSDNLCHAGAIFGGFKQLWPADKLDWRTEKSRVVEAMDLTRNEHQETEGAYGRHF
jgi:hypothetical protein